MAETTDVCNAIANAVQGIVSPLVRQQFAITEIVDANAVGAQQTVPSTTVGLSRPLQKDLEDRLAAGKAIITVEPDDNDAPTTQYVNEGKKMALASRSAVTLTATPDRTNPLAFDLGGPVSAGNIIGVQAGPLGATYVVQQNDTLASVAAGLAASAIAAGIIATSNGAQFILDPSAAGATIQIGAPSTWTRAVSRRCKSFDVLFWMPDPYLRSYLVGVTEAVFSPGQKLTMPDGSAATVIGTSGTLSWNTQISDQAGRDNLFLARTRWLVEYTVTRSVTKAPIVAATVALAAADIDVSAPLLASQL